VDFTGEQLRFLSYGRVLDTTRMRTRLGFEPRYTTREAFTDFARSRGLSGPLNVDVVGLAERLIRRGAGRVLQRVGSGT